MRWLQRSAARAHAILNHAQHRRGRCELAHPAPRVDGSALYVSYADAATLRRRLLGVAQQVRGKLVREPLPELVMPKGRRVRHGFWFMRFADAENLAAAKELLHGAKFESECKTMAGTLQVDEGTRPDGLDVRAMLNMSPQSHELIEEWLHRRFKPYGPIEALRMPRLLNNWDSGFGFVHYSQPEHAEAALDALDGTVSPVPGCSMYVDYATHKPLAAVRPLPP